MHGIDRHGAIAQSGSDSLKELIQMWQRLSQQSDAPIKQHLDCQAKVGERILAGLKQRQSMEVARLPTQKLREIEMEISGVAGELIRHGLSVDDLIAKVAIKSIVLELSMLGLLERFEQAPKAARR